MDNRTRQLCDLIKLHYSVDLLKAKIDKITFDFVNKLTTIKIVNDEEIKLKDDIDIELLSYMLYNVMGVINIVELIERLKLTTLPLILHFDKFEANQFVILPNHYGVLCMDLQMRMGNCINAKIIPFLPSQLAN